MLAPGFGPALTDAEMSEDVIFGVPRTRLLPGLDLESTCHVTASYRSVTVRDTQSASAFLTARPGACSTALYVLGVRIELPFTFATPLGRLSLFLPNVRLYTFGAVDVTIDMSARLRADVSGDGSVLSASPAVVEWTTWGPVETTVTAHSGVRGSTMSAYETFRLVLTFDLVVAVKLLGVTIFDWSANLATWQGTPDVRVPVVIDLLPSLPLIRMARAPLPREVDVLWTQSRDEDFARYEITVTGGGVRRTFVVADRDEDTLSIDAKPMTTYSIVVTVVDQGGSSASSRAVSVTTPRDGGPPEHFVLAAPPGSGLSR